MQNDLKNALCEINTVDYDRTYFRNDNLASGPLLGGLSASERSGDKVNGFKDLHMKAKSRIWPCLSCISHIRSIAVWCEFDRMLRGLERFFLVTPSRPSNLDIHQDP